MQGGTRLFLKPGRGKTSTTLKAFQILKKLGIVDAMLVVGPLRVVTTSWPQECEKWEDFADFKVATIHGGKTARIAAMKQDADVYLMNAEGLLTSEWKLGNMGKMNAVAEGFLSGKRIMLVADESTMFKDSSTTRFRTLKRYLPLFERVVILTGTPQPKNLEDLFAQCYLTDRGEDLGRYVTHFRNSYMQPDPAAGGRRGAFIPQVGAMARVAAKIAPTTLQLDAEEVVPVEEINIWVPMPEGLYAQYRELRDEFLTSIQGRTVMAPNSGVLFGKLRQFAQGAMWVPGEEDYLTLHDAKLDKLQGLLEELNGEPLFCLYAYRHDFDRINQRLGYTVPRIGSGVSAAEGRDYCRAFGAGSLPILLGHPQSVARGVDGLQNNCSTMCWFGQDWSWELNYQAQQRICRPGTKAESVTIYRIMLDCGIERAMLASVSEKQSNEAEFLRLLREVL